MKKLMTACAVLALTACTTTDPTVQTQVVNVHFAAEINGEPFACGQRYTGVGTTQSTITPSDFRMFVSDMKLLRTDGSSVPVQLLQDGMWQYQNLALLDFENGQGPCKNGTAALNTSIRGSVPKGNYSGIEFTVGVPFALNHQDPTIAPAPLNSTAMFWNWQGGYKFIKFDTSSSIHSNQAAGNITSGPITRYSVHLGSTVCTSSGKTQPPNNHCQNPNRITVRLDRFNPQKQSVVVDMGVVLAQANVDVNAKGTSPGCMSFPKDADCPPVMNALGLSYDGIASTSTQRLITAR